MQYKKNPSDLFEYCENELKRLVKKTGYVFSYEELNNLDFSKYNKDILILSHLKWEEINVSSQKFYKSVFIF